MENSINVTITGDSTQLTKAVMDAERHLNGFQKTMDDVGKYVNSWTVKMQAASMVFVGLRNAFQVTYAVVNNIAGSFMEFGDQLSKTSQRIGMSVETLGGLKYAAEQCGSNFEEMTDAVKTFQEQLGAAKLGDTGAIGKLGAVGIRAEDFDGLSSEEQFLKLADHIRQIGDRAEQTRTAIELFGDAGFRLLPFLQEGSEGIKKIIEDGKGIGAVFGEEAAKKASALSNSIKRLNTSFSNMANSAMSLLAPVMTSILEIIAKLLAGITWLAKEGQSTVLGITIASAALTIQTQHLMIANRAGVAYALTMKALNAAMSMLSKNPWGLIIMGSFMLAGAAMDFFQHKARKTAQSVDESTQKLCQGAKNIASAWKEAKTEHKEKDEELKKEVDSWKEISEAIDELNSKESLNNAEKREMAKLVDSLKRKFPELGISIDENTGKIKNLQEATLALLEAEEKQKLNLANKKISDAQTTYTKAIQQEEKALGQLRKIREGGGTGAGLASRIEDGNYEETGYANLDNLATALKLARETKDSALNYLNDAKDEKNAIEKDIAERKRNHAFGTADSASDSMVAFLEKESGSDEFEKERREIRKEFAKLRKETDDGIDALETLQKSEGLDKKDAEKLARLKTFRDTLDVREEDKLALVDEKELAAFQEWQDSLETPELSGPEDPKRKKWDDRVRNREDQLADAIASGDQDKVAIARENVEEAKRNRDLAFMKAAGKEYREAMEELKKAQMSGSWEEIEKAEKNVELKRQEYLEYSGRVQSNREGREPLPEEEVQDAVQTSMRVSGAFSAYGLEAAAAGTNIAMETLDYIKKIFGQVEEVKNNQTAGVLE